MTMHDYLDAHQIKAVEALKLVKAICEKHGIQYYLLAGSTLGAVRHQGFIPWDDDIDVGVPYEDWYRLREILAKEITGDFVYMDNGIDPNFPRFMGKILHNGQNCVDLFILVKWTDKFWSGNCHWQIRRLMVESLKYSIGYKHPPKKKANLKQRIWFFIVTTIRKAFYQVFRLFWDRDDFIRLARENEKAFMDKDTNYYINLYSVYRMKKEMIKKEWLDGYTMVTFEDDVYPTVTDTHAYLTHLYGDYMTPPPQKERIMLHGEKFN